MEKENFKKTLLKLSPNEIDRLSSEVRQKNRIFRIQQVRAQSKEHSTRLLAQVRSAELQEKEKIKKTLHCEWDKKQDEKICQVQLQLEEAVAGFGKAHEAAQEQVEKMAAYDSELQKKEIQAKKRGREALKTLQKEKENKENCRKFAVKQKKQIIINEKNRARRVAALQTPPRIRQMRSKKKSPVKQKVMVYEHGTFLTSSYVPSKTLVTKESKTNCSVNAWEAAKKERDEEKRQELLKKKEQEERFERALDRGREALKKERHMHVRFNLNPPPEDSSDAVSSSSSQQKEISSLTSDVSEKHVSFDVLGPSTANDDIHIKETIPLKLKSMDISDNTQHGTDINSNDTNFQKDSSLKQLKAYQNLISNIEHVTKTDQSLSSIDTKLNNDSDFKSSSENSSKTSNETSNTTGSSAASKIVSESSESSTVSSKILQDSPESSTISSKTLIESSESSTSGKLPAESIDIHNKSTCPIELKVPVKLSDMEFLKSVRNCSYKDLPEPQIPKSLSDLYGKISTTASKGVEEPFDHIEINIKKIQENRKQINGFLSDINPSRSKYQNHSNNSSGTEYMDLPQWRNDIHKKFDNIENRHKKVQKLLTDLKSIPVKPAVRQKVTTDSSGTEYMDLPGSNTEKCGLKQTPIRYTAPMKEEGSSRKLVSKRQKFEEQKRLLIRKYMEQLLNMKAQDLTTSTVTSSLTLPSPFSSEESPREFTKSILKCHSTPNEEVSSTQSVTSSGVTESSMSSNVNSFSLNPEQLCKLKQIATDLEKLDRLKNMVMEKINETSSSNSRSGSNYQELLQSNSSLTVHDSPNTFSTDFSAKESTVGDSCTINSSLKPLTSSTPTEGGTSLTDLDELLQRNDLKWAQSMLKQMDLADKRMSSDDSSRI